MLMQATFQNIQKNLIIFCNSTFASLPVQSSCMRPLRVRFSLQWGFLLGHSALPAELVFDGNNPQDPQQHPLLPHMIPTTSQTLTFTASQLLYFESPCFIQRDTL